MPVGKIVKGIAGFYYVIPTGAQADYAGEPYECKAKGAFRSAGQKPLVGDNVEFEILDEENRKGNIVKLLPRQSSIIRPEVANIDGALVVFALKTPDPNLNLLDRFLIMMEQQGLHCAICFNKQDVVSEEELRVITETYRDSGCVLFFTSAKERIGIEAVREYLSHRTTALAGPSGVGKSSLINALSAETVAKTGEISVKNERGKHTTRHSEILPIAEDTFLMDTPGFSSLSVFEMEKEDLRFYYPEFEPYEGQCRYTGCTHVHEPGCVVKEKTADGQIPKIRYENYLQIFHEVEESARRRR